MADERSFATAGAIWLTSLPVPFTINGVLRKQHAIRRCHERRVQNGPAPGRDSLVRQRLPAQQSTGSPSPSASQTAGNSNSTASPTPTVAANAVGAARISKVVSASDTSCIGGTVQVTTDLINPASTDRQLWLMAVVITGTSPHPVYFAKRKLTDSLGSQQAIISFGSAVGSSRDLIITSAARGAFSWLKKNLEHDGDPTWDIHRVKLPSDVVQISRPYKVTRTC